MAVLKWDEMGKKRFRHGISKVVLFLLEGTGTDAKWTGHAWSGVTNVTQSPDGGDAEDYYADNILYASLRGMENLNGSIEAYDYPDEFEECIGGAELTDGITIRQQPKRVFCLAYREEVGNDTNPEASYDIHVIYNCTANAAELSHDTMEESPNLEPMSFDYDSNPVPVTGHKPTSAITIHSATVTKANMTKIENKLYGTDSTESELLMPDKLLELITKP